MEKDDNRVKEISERGLRKDSLYLFDSSPDVGPKNSQTVCFCNPIPHREWDWAEFLASSNPTHAFPSSCFDS